MIYLSVCWEIHQQLNHLVHAYNPMLSEHLHDMVMISPEVKIKGIHYIPGTVLIYNWPALNLLEFVTILPCIIVYQQNKQFHCTKLEIQEFSAHFNSFDVAETAETFVIRSDTTIVGHSFFTSHIITCMSYSSVQFDVWTQQHVFSPSLVIFVYALLKLMNTAL